MRLSKKIREAVSALSTGGVGTYYKNPIEWFDALAKVLATFDIDIESDCPYFYSVLRLSEGDNQVYYTYFRMASGNWEIIGYLT